VTTKKLSWRINIKQLEVNNSYFINFMLSKVDAQYMNQALEHKVVPPPLFVHNRPTIFDVLKVVRVKY